MQRVTPEEAARIAWVTYIDHNHIYDIFERAYKERLGGTQDYTWATMCAADACYIAGRIDGIRAERERRKNRAK